jgi:argonaute-like protein implicated in RNA metabolism and viral defense
MPLRFTSLLLLATCVASSVIIDRIAVIIENRIVKESDIKRDIRVTSFLNSETPDFSVASQRKALNRLIDQVFIRREIEVGDYPTATLQQDVRFKPAVLITDDEVQEYYREHAAALHRDYPGKSSDDLMQRIREILTDEKVNQQFFTWLDERRKGTKVEFRETSLR